MSSRWHTLLAVDFDRWAAETYRANFPGVRVECGAVAEVLDALRWPGCDVLIGGPPCQPHSLAGKRAASDDVRDGGPDFARAVHLIQPRMFLMENVAGLLSSEGGAYCQRLFAELERSGFVVAYRVQNAVSFGVPQFRARVWVWGIRRDLYVDGVRHMWPAATHEWPPPAPCMFGAALLPAVTIRQACGCSWWANECNTSNARSRLPRSADEPVSTIYGGGNTMGGLLLAMPGSEPHRLDRPSPAICATEGKGARHQKFDPTCTPMRLGDVLWRSTGVRRATVPECLRLQTGPDDFIWPEGITKRAMYGIVGNGWACGHAAHFSRALAAADPDSRTVVDLFCGGGLGACGFHGRYWQYEPQQEREAV